MLARSLLWAVTAAVVAAGADAAEPDWNALAGVAVPEIVTLDEDGSERVTKLWLVVVDGQGYLRTGDTTWHRNIERNPDVVLRIEGSSHPLRATHVTDPELRARIQAAFREKYGFQDRVVSLFGSEERAQLLRLDPRP
ncbi:MAG TPA: nitroreductase/quinone reductase family protein [Myxococcota bacterium]|nr:nitroreductase/quinone reductase family protein [Myxococcota bacterium]